ncbi:hypothetical protein TH63_18515 [Rufibacter radiotolerans]|uniref:Uncharacterized protein n=1 Tax=Rufibacter radiotolerans TaxID=1379910 RepID=A0A0H4W9P3_9BACT|nr:hypothetical protein [Rufibacter radiotolerans]AKQ47181.1 hypothetical protein TH63_18515 [Rufibacter radiotolerans]
MLDIASTTSGLLIPRMTTAQRDAIESPPTGLQIFNLTSNALEFYQNTAWVPVSYVRPESNLVRVYSLADLPAPGAGGITLDATKMYVFAGIIDISPNYLNLNGASLKGTDPGRDGVFSTVAGGVLRSNDVNVFIQDFAVVPGSGATKAYDFSDGTGTKFCNLFSGASVVEMGIPSAGVGQVSGFRAITFVKNYWKASDGLKVTGNVGKFAASLNYVTGVTNGSGLEFLSNLTVQDIDLSNNYFMYTGQTGVKVNSGASIDRGRMSTNMFRGVANFLSGFDSYTPEWEMRQNTFVPDSRAFCALYMNDNSISTPLPIANTYYKVAGTTINTKSLRFVAANNRTTYIGKTDITARVNVVISARSNANSSEFSIAIAKNGVVIPMPFGSIAPTGNNQSFQMSLLTEVDLTANDYVEVFIKSNNGNTSNLVIAEMQVQISD